MLLGSAHNGCQVGKLLITSDGNRLNEELVTAFGIGRRLLLHSLQDDCHITVSG